jgi:hypothetical protein
VDERRWLDVPHVTRAGQTRGRSCSAGAPPRQVFGVRRPPHHLHDAIVLRFPAFLMLGVTAALLSCCSTSAPLAGYSVGPAGHEVRIEAVPGLRLHPSVAGGTSVGTAALPGAVNDTTTLSLPDDGTVEVSISLPPVPVAPARDGVRPCSPAAGTCPGTSAQSRSTGVAPRTPSPLPAGDRTLHGR